MLPVTVSPPPVATSTPMLRQLDSAPVAEESGEFGAVLASAEADNALAGNALPTAPGHGQLSSRSAEEDMVTPAETERGTETGSPKEPSTEDDVPDDPAATLLLGAATEMPDLGDADECICGPSVPDPAMFLAPLSQQIDPRSCNLGSPDILAESKEPQQDPGSGPTKEWRAEVHPVIAASGIAEVLLDHQGVAATTGIEPMERVETGSEGPGRSAEKRLPGTEQLTLGNAAHIAVDGVVLDGGSAPDTEDPGSISFGSVPAPTSAISPSVNAGGTSNTRLALSVVQLGISATPSVLGPEIARIARSASGDETEIRLAPKELGRLRIRLSIESDTPRVSIQAERPETLDLLRRNGDLLVKELRAAGFSGGTLDFAGWSDGNRRSSSSADQVKAYVGEAVSFASVGFPPQDSSARIETGLNLRL